MIRGEPQRVVADLTHRLNEWEYDVKVMSLMFNPEETFERFSSLKVHNISGETGRKMLKSLIRKFIWRFGKLQPYIGGVPANVFITPLLTFYGFVLYKPEVIILNGGHTFIGALRLIVRRPIVIYYHGDPETYLKHSLLSRLLSPFEKASMILAYPCVVSEKRLKYSSRLLALNLSHCTRQ